MPVVVFPIVLVLVFLSVVIFAIVSSTANQKKRAEAIRKFAEELGLSFFPEGDSRTTDPFASFKILQKGRRRKFRNLIVAATDDVSIAIFDYQYTTGSGKNKRTHHRTISVVSSTSFRLPPFHARPENVFDAIGNVIGLQDIDFDQHPEFSKAFVLKSNSESETRDFFDLPLLDFFAARKTLCFEGYGQSFLYYEGHRRLPAEEMRSWIEEGYAVYDAIRDRLER